jgi:septal ring factor EnvC (AmiA/AmiB activator)
MSDFTPSELKRAARFVQSHHRQLEAEIARLKAELSVTNQAGFEMGAEHRAEIDRLTDDLEAAYGQRDDNWRKLCEVSAALVLRQRVVDAAIALAPMLMTQIDDDPERYAQFWPEAAELRNAVAALDLSDYWNTIDRDPQVQRRRAELEGRELKRGMTDSWEPVTDG